MDRVPLEVFTKITSYLKCSEKLELLQVCQYWRNSIQCTNLYNDVTTKRKARFQQALSVLDSEELYARQVHRLQLIKPETDFLTVLKLPSLFPHLKEFIWEDYANENYDEESIPTDLEQQLEHWQKLISITETNRFLYMPSILRSGELPNLTRLNINLHFSSNIGDDIINYLHHAPVLKVLEITHITLSLQQLEDLHEKAPQLEMLYLNDVTQVESDFDTQYMSEILLEDDSRQIIITPATKLHTLNLDRVMFQGIRYGMERHWLKYISEKYTEMVNFSIHGVGMGSDPQSYYETGLTWIAESCCKLKKYKVKIFPLTSAILSAMDVSGIQLEVLDIMSDGTAQDQLIDLSHSHQKDYLNSINIRTISGSDDMYYTLSDFPLLTKLDISTTASITINTLLKKLNQLESLSLSSCDVCIDTEDKDTFQLKLKSLNLEKVMINNKDDIFGYLATSSPWLNKLCIQGQVSDTKVGPLKVHFPSQYFRSIKVYILGNSYYKVNNDREITWYRFRGKVLQEKLQHEYSGFQDNFYVSISYKGLTNFNIGGTIIPNY